MTETYVVHVHRNGGMTREAFISSDGAKALRAAREFATAMRRRRDTDQVIVLRAAPERLPVHRVYGRPYALDSSGIILTPAENPTELTNYETPEEESK